MQAATVIKMALTCSHVNNDKELIDLYFENYIAQFGRARSRSVGKWGILVHGRRGHAIRFREASRQERCQRRHRSERRGGEPKPAARRRHRR
jgi:hypothetical protein